MEILLLILALVVIAGTYGVLCIIFDDSDITTYKEDV